MKIIILYFFSVILLFMGCSESELDTSRTPTLNNRLLYCDSIQGYFEAFNAHVPYTLETTFSVCSHDVPWKICGDCEWVKFSVMPTPSKGEYFDYFYGYQLTNAHYLDVKFIKINVVDNTMPYDRTAVFYLVSTDSTYKYEKPIYIVQKGDLYPMYINIKEKELNVAADASSYSIPITASSYPYCSSEDIWIHCYIGPDDKNGKYTLFVDIDDNSQSAKSFRTGHINIEVHKTSDANDSRYLSEQIIINQSSNQFSSQSEEHE